MPHPASVAETRAQRVWKSGRQLAQRGLWAEAAERFRIAERLRPDDPLYAMTLGQAFLRLNETARALEALGRAAALRPEDHSLMGAQAACLQALGRPEELVALLQPHARDRIPVSLLKMLASAQRQLGLEADAVQTWLLVLAQDLADVEVHRQLGYTFHHMGLKQEAAECLRTVLALRDEPGRVDVRDILYMFERDVCNWQAGMRPLEDLKKLARALPNDAAEAVDPFCFAVLCDDPEINLKVARARARLVQGSIASLPPRHPTARERLRVGYVSADFQLHATSILMAEMLENHDRSRFEVFLYSHGRAEDNEMTRRVRSSTEHFVDLHNVSLPEMARRIRDDGIDILVDLKGYTQGTRFPLFAARPAPVQVSYLGFPGSSGAGFIDYIIGDPWVTPLSHAAHYSEKIAQLPTCYQCNDGRRDIPVADSRVKHGLPEGPVVFCVFNQLYKISPEVFDLWCRILLQVPGSILWMLAWHEAAPASLREEAAKRGVDPNRLVFAPKLPVGPHLNRMACADIFLDPWPCNGHTSASDALWAGLPVVTLSGETFASRVAGSLVHAIGIPELVCSRVEQYEQLAVDLATDVERRSEVRERVAAARTASPLFDGKLRAREIERLFERMWERVMAGQSPDHLPA